MMDLWETSPFLSKFSARTATSLSSYTSQNIFYQGRPSISTKIYLIFFFLPGVPALGRPCVSPPLHIPLCWVLVSKPGLGNHGAALAISISYWLNMICLGLYMKYSSACAKTRTPISMEIFQGIREFFRFAIPSAVMTWSFSTFYPVVRKRFLCSALLCYSSLMCLFILIFAALTGGLLSFLYCFLGYYQIRSLKLQFFLYGKFS
jgi:hypothetical protein